LNIKGTINAGVTYVKDFQFFVSPLTVQRYLSREIVVYKEVKWERLKETQTFIFSDIYIVYSDGKRFSQDSSDN